MMITASDIAKRHPIDLLCDTDSDYALIANRVYDLLQDSIRYIKNEEHKKEICINIALYFEDLKSGTHQFEVFTKLYKEWFGLYLPFYTAENADSPTAQLDAMTFVFWHTLSSRSDSSIMNPLNDDIRKVSTELLEFWHTHEKDMPSNNMLADYIFSETTQETPHDLRDVLSWIECRSFLGRWFTNSCPEEDEYNLETLLKEASAEQRQYCADCISTFEHKAWPLSLPATRIYAEMIRMEMEDPDDEIAAEIEKMQSSHFGLYNIVRVDDNGFKLKDFKGDTYFISCTYKDRLKLMRKHAFIICGLFSYRGKWYMNGTTSLIAGDKSKKDEAFAKYSEMEMPAYSAFHNYTNQYDEFIKKQNGKRMFFFKNRKEYEKWLYDSFGIKDKGTLKEHGFRNNPLLAYIEDYGQMSLTTIVEHISHPDNPFYDEDIAKDRPLLICEKDFITKGLALYIVEHNLLPNARFNDIKGDEHGRLLFQENIDFLVRCLRRDIDKTDVYHKRHKDLFAPDKDKDYSEPTPIGKLPLSVFAKMLFDHDVFTNKANKKWQLEKCNIEVTIVKDVNKDKFLYISTKQMYEAYLALTVDQITVDNLIPFVGRANASAASAILNTINIASRDLILNSLADMYSEYLKERFKNDHSK